MRVFNLRLILIHIASALLSAISFEILSLLLMLKYLPFTEQRSLYVDTKWAVEHRLYLGDMYDYAFTVSLALLVALLISLVQSILVGRRLRVHWINSLVAIILAYGLYYTLVNVFNLAQPNYYFNLKNSYVDILAKGLPFLLGGQLLLYSSKIQRFIRQEVELLPTT